MMGSKALGKGHEVTIEGCLVGMHEDNQPVFIELDSVAPAVLLPIFTSRGTLARAKRGMPSYRYDRLVRIEYGPDFLASIPNDGSIEVVLDPWVTPEGNTRFKRILRDSSN